MPSNRLILCRPLLLPPSVFPNIRVFSNESVLHIKWPKYWSFSFNIGSSSEHSGLISLRMDWLDLLAVQGTLKSPIQHHCKWWLQPWNSKMLTPWKESYDQPRQHIKKQRHYFANKGPSHQTYGFSSSHVWMWELDSEESWVLKNWCFWTVVLEKTLESPLDCKKSQPVHPKGNQSRIFIGRTDVEAQSPILWPPDVKSWLIWKDPDDGKDWRQKKGMTEDEMVHGITDSMGMSLNKFWVLVMNREAWHAAVHGVQKSWTRQSNWTELN